MSSVFFSRFILFTLIVLLFCGCTEEEGSPVSLPPGTISISIRITPPDSDVTWVLAGPEEYSYGGRGDEDVVNINAGQYTLTPGPFDGMVAPEPQIVTINGGSSMTLTIAYAAQQATPREIIMVDIPSGTFEMGSSDSVLYGRENERPQHIVNISSLVASETEITERQFFDIMTDGIEAFSGCEDCAVAFVSFREAVLFCNALSIIDGYEPAYGLNESEILFFIDTNGYRLPTEAEWEYLCRAGSGNDFTNGDISVCCDQLDENLDLVAWYGYNANEAVNIVATKEANTFGLYDTHGNVREWCWDWMGDYSEEEQSDPTGPETGTDKIVRGGSWNSGANACQSAYRTSMNAQLNDFETGFRIVRSIN
jgi:formylglycine-generating enzyme required for sulfatase activity